MSAVPDGVGLAEPVKLFVSVPVTCLKSPKAREYFETLPCPAPATVYGMLLSLVGEEDRMAYTGTEIAVGVVGNPQVSTVLRTVWRVKNKKEDPGLGENKRPDFQELLTGLTLVVWVRDGKDKNKPSLSSRIREAFRTPQNVKRFGGLSLGESTHLVDEIRPWRVGDPTSARMLINDPAGDLTLPIWVDHVGSVKTVFRQYRLEEVSLDEAREDVWTEILLPEGEQ